MHFRGKVHFKLYALFNNNNITGQNKQSNSGKIAVKILKI